MIDFRIVQLDNGLTVIVHEDQSSAFVSTDVLYNVGSKNEQEDKTGFAHLFEHLMFGGSLNIPDYDSPLQKAGGDSNAFTTTDITNYYESLPAANLETALWLESDRMLQLNFNQRSLDIQKKVVIEEFKENYINQPYGDVWHLLMELAYKEHPYKWPTIGLIPKHIEDAKLDDVKSFFNDYYNPNNAILVIAGGIKYDEVMPLVEKWFGDIPLGKIPDRSYKQEAEQFSERKKIVHRNVPIDSIFKVFHMSDRFHKEYYITDLLTDILSNGNSSKLNQDLVKDEKLFTSANAYISDTIDPGLIIVEAKLPPDSNMEEASERLDEYLFDIHKNIEVKDLSKVKIKNESALTFSKVNLTTRAINLAYYHLLGDANLINTEEEIYNAIHIDEILNLSKSTFTKEHCSTLLYKSN